MRRDGVCVMNLGAIGTALLRCSTAASVVASVPAFYVYDATPGRPCDIYAAQGVPCVAAHSTVRSLYANFSGALYLVQRSSDGATREIRVSTQGGLADGAAQDLFCAASTCRVKRIFDQSPRGNHLDVGTPRPPRSNCSDVGNHSDCPGCEPLPPPATCDIGVNASRAMVTTPGGHHSYAAYFTGGMGYHFNGSNASGMPVGDEPESMYIVTSGRFYNNQCCFDCRSCQTCLLLCACMRLFDFRIPSVHASVHDCVHACVSPEQTATLRLSFYPKARGQWKQCNSARWSGQVTVEKETAPLDHGVANGYAIIHTVAIFMLA